MSQVKEEKYFLAGYIQSCLGIYGVYGGVQSSFSDGVWAFTVARVVKWESIKTSNQ